jgi:hypothetical protein
MRVPEEEERALARQEQEELDVALALSLSLASPQHQRQQQQEEEQQWRRPAVLPPPPPPPPAPPPRPRGHPNHPNHRALVSPPPPPPPHDPNACAGCRRPFELGARYLIALGRSWHAVCFVCAACGQPFGGEEDSNRSFVVGQDGGGAPCPYHPRCHRALFSPTCCVCGESVPELGAGLGGARWREHVFWRAEQRYCPGAGCGREGGTLTCLACDRLRPRRGGGGGGGGWSDLPDGRAMCPDCAESIVADTADAQPLYGEVLAFMERVLQRPAGGAAGGGGGGGGSKAFPHRPPLHLVDGPTMQAHALREGRRDDDEDDDDDEE